MYRSDYPFSFSSQPTPYTDSQILEKGTTEYKKGITNYFIELISGQKETANMMNVCYRTEYKNYSQEELRIADYLIKKRNQASNSTFNFFGNNNNTNVSGPFFKSQFDPASININNGGINNNNIFSASTPVNNSPFSLLNSNNTSNNNNPFNLKSPFSNNIFNSNNQTNTTNTNPFLPQSNVTNTTNTSNNTNFFNSNFNLNKNNNTTQNGSNVFPGFLTNNSNTNQNPFVLQATNIQTNNNNIFSNQSNNNPFNPNGNLNNNQNNTNIFFNNHNNSTNSNPIFQNNNISIFNQPNQSIFSNSNNSNNFNNNNNITHNYSNPYPNYSYGSNVNPFFINGENRRIDQANFIHYHCCPIIPRSSIGEQQIMKLNEINNELYLERNKFILGLSDEDTNSGLPFIVKNDSI